MLRNSTHGSKRRRPEDLNGKRHRPLPRMLRRALELSQACHKDLREGRKLSVEHVMLGWDALIIIELAEIAEEQKRGKRQ